MTEALDKGHYELIKDLKALLAMAENYEFHDFKNENYATPKVQLGNFLHELRQNVINGKYDN